MASRLRRVAVPAAALVLAASGVVSSPAPVASAERAALLPAAGVSTGIDGFTPILFNETGPQAGLKAWTIAHHGQRPMTDPKIFCTDVATGVTCPDKNDAKTFPMPLNTQALPLSTDTPGDISTTEVPQFAFDPSLPRVYYPAVTNRSISGFPNGSVGVGCVDLQQQVNCAYTPLLGLTNTVDQSNVNGLTGFVQSGTRLYGTATNGQELCYDMSIQQACLGQPYATNTPPNSDKAGIGPNDYYGAKAVVNNRIFTTSNSPAGSQKTLNPQPPTLTCFDPVTNAPCLGWTPKVFTDSNNYLAISVFPQHNALGAETGVCAVISKLNTQAPTVSCYDFLLGTPTATPPGLAGLFPSGGVRSVVFPPTRVSADGNLRTFFPFYTEDDTYRGHTLCYSWTNQAPCAGFPNPAGHPDVNGGNTHDYGYTYSAATGCLFGNGHTGYLFSLDPDTGATGC